MSTTPATVSFLPGQRIPETGIYECKHSNRHTGSRDSVFEGGGKFPLCRVCFWSVRYAFVSYVKPVNAGHIGKNQKLAS